MSGRRRSFAAAASAALLLGAFAMPVPAGAADAIASAPFETLDADGDGAIDEAEARAIPRFDGAQFLALDLDRDRRVTRDELEEHRRQLEESAERDATPGLAAPGSAEARIEGTAPSSGPGAVE